MNWIQQHVLIELTKHATLRYSQLRPDGVEGNLFLYHLEGLIKDGMVEKGDRSYHLSPKGLSLVGTLSLTTGKQRRQPKILNAMVCRNAEGQYLLSRWRRQPNTGLISFPHGMMHFGSGLLDMANLELAEKTGFSADLTYRGDVYIRTVSDGEVTDHLLVHVFNAARPVPLADPKLRLDAAESFWGDLADYPAEAFVPGFYELAQLVTNQPDGPIFADLTVSPSA